MVSPEQAVNADLIALVLPASAVREILEQLQVLVKKGAMVLNRDQAGCPYAIKFLSDD